MSEERKVIYPANAARPGGPYSPGILDGGFLFVAGQVGRDPATGQFAGEGLEAQARQTLENIRTLLEAAGCSFKDVVKTNVYLGRAEFFAPFNQVYREFAVEPYPARTTIVCTLPDPAALIEIDVIARQR